MRTTIPFTGILFATAAIMLMQTVVATILPQIVDELGGETLYSWVFSIYLLTSTISIPLCAKLADSYGYKTFFIIGMIVFLAGSLLCGAAVSMVMLILARMVQGLGAGAIAPVTIALIGTLFSLEERGKAMGLYAAVQLLANVSGPMIGGMTAHYWGWQYSFYIVIPFGLLSILLIRRYIQQTGKPNISFRQLDVIGAILLGGAIACIVQAMNRIGHTGFEGIAFVFCCVSALLLGLFIMQEKRHKNPVISTELIRVKNVLLANASAFLVGLLMYGAIILLPMYSSKVLGAGSINSGKLLIPFMAGMGVGVIIGGRIIKNYSYRAIARIGWLISCTSLVALSVMSALQIFGLGSYMIVFPMGFGLGLLLPTFLLPAQNAVSEHEQAIVGGMIQLSRNIGGAVGIPVITGLLSIGGDINESASGFWIVFMCLAACSIVGLFIGRQYKGSIQEDAVVQANNAS